MPVVNRTSIWLPFALLVGAAAILLGIIFASLALVTSTDRQIRSAGDAQEVRLHGFRLLSLMQDAETGQRGYLLTGDRVYLEPFVRAQSAVVVELNGVAAALRQDGREADLTAIRALVEAKFAELNQTVELRRAGRTQEALDVVNTQRGKTVMDTLRLQLDGLIEDANQRVQQHLAELHEATVLQRNVSLGGGAAIVMLASAAGLMVLRYTGALQTATSEVERLNQGLERRVLERTSDLKRANDEIQRFAYIVSHDLRAPLVNVMGFTRELETSLVDLKEAFAQPGVAAPPPAATTVVEQDMPEAIGFIRASTQKMDGLINAILRLSREGGRTLTATQVELNALFTQSEASLRHQLDEVGATLTIAPNLPKVRSDQMALEQIFGNLLDNAIKYLAPGRPGRIEVRAHNGEAGRIIVEVADNGRGIAEQDQERVFELFRRAGKQDTRGEGIGLAHVRALARRLGGDVTVESTAGEGSTFRVILPRVMPSATSEDA